MYNFCIRPNTLSCGTRTASMRLDSGNRSSSLRLHRAQIGCSFKKNENESDGGECSERSSRDSRASPRPASAERTSLRQGYVVGAATGVRRDWRDVTGAGNACPLIVTVTF